MPNVSMVLSWRFAHATQKPAACLILPGAVSAAAGEP
jgi:hypothetical protein